MKKYILTIILLILFFPLLVFAEDTDITISDLEFVSSEGYTEETTPAEIVNNQIKLDLKMIEVGDSISYKIKIKNNRNEDYIVDSTSVMHDDNYMRYTLENDEHSYLLKPGEEKEYVLNAIYQNEVERDKFRAGIFTLDKDEYFNITPDSLLNPKTGSFFFIILSLCIVIFTMMFLPKKQKVLSLFILIIIPLMVHAEGVYQLVLDSNIVFDYFTPNLCTYDGELVQGAEFIDGQFTYRYMQEFGTYDSNVSTYVWGNIETDGWGVHITDPTSTDPVTTTLCTSINDKPIVSMKYMFNNSRTTSIDTSSFDTRNVTNMNSMFLSTSNIEEIDLINFNTSQVTNIASMISNSPKLKELDVSSWDTSKVSSLSAFVNTNTNSLTSIDFSGWDFSSITSASVFVNLTGGVPSSLKKVNFSNVIFPSNCNSFFIYINNVEELILDNVDTSHVTNMTAMFANVKFEKLDFSGWDTSNVNSYQSFLSGATNLIEVDLSNFSFQYCYSSSSYGGMLSGTTSLKKVIAKNWIIPDSFSHSFFRAFSTNNSPIEEIDVTGWDLSKATYLSGLFGSGAYGGAIGTGGTGLTSIIGLDTWDTSNITNMSYMFQGLSSLENLDISNFNTSKVTDMSYMFQGMTSITKLDVSCLDVTNVTKTTNMFTGDTGLVELDLSGWNFLSGSSKLTGIFSGLSSLKKLVVQEWVIPDYFSFSLLDGSGLKDSPIEEVDVTGWDLRNADRMEGIFKPSSYAAEGKGGRGLKRIIGLETWDTSNASDLGYMFYGLNSITSLDLSNFDTSNDNDLSYMFYNCSSLTKLDLSNFNTSKVTNMNYTFYGASSLTEINLSSFNLSNIQYSESTFEGAVSLRAIDTPQNMGTYNFTSYLPAVFGDGDVYCTQFKDAPANSRITIAGAKLTYNMNNKLKTIAGDVNNIYEIKRSENPPADLSSATNVADSNSTIPIYTWYDNNIIYYYSEGETIFLNEYSYSFFSGMKNLYNIEAPDYSTYFVTDMSNMFHDTSSNYTGDLELDLSDLSIDRVTDMRYMFDCYGKNANSVTITATDWDLTNAEYMSYMFYEIAKNANKLVLNIPNWNMPKAATVEYFMDDAAYYATEVNIDASNWNFAVLQNASGMFTGLGHNASTFILDLKDWNTSSFTSIKDMFSYTNQNRDIATTTFKLDVSGWDTSNVTNMYNVFYYAFQNVPNFSITGLSSWNTSSVTNMAQMFYACGEHSPKINLDLSNWNVSNVESFSYMFKSIGYHATELSLGDLSGWVIKEGAYLSDMFYYANYDGNVDLDIGTLTIPTADISTIFCGANLTATVNLTGNPSDYSYAFDTTSQKSGSVVVNYTSAVTDIDAIIATKSENSNVVKGELITT